MSALRELLVFFGVQVDGAQKLDQVGAKMEGLRSIALRAGSTLGLAFGLHEIAGFITKQIELGAELLHTSEMLGMTTHDLQAFEFAARNSGLSAEQADTALRFLNKNLGKAAEGGKEVAAVFARLGVKTKTATGEVRPTQEVLGDIADGISKMKSPAEKTTAAIEIFGRAGAKMIPLLNKGSTGVIELTKEFDALGGGLSQEFVEAAAKGERQMIRLNTAGKGLVGVFATALMPAFTALVSWVSDNIASFREFTSHSYIVQTALATLGVAALILAGICAVLNIEIFLVIGAIALMILVVDDFYTAMKGGKSVIGDFVDELFGIGATKSVFDNLKFWAGETYDVILKIVNGIKLGINGLSQLVNEGAHALANLNPLGAGDEENARYARVTKKLEKRGADLVDEHDKIGGMGVDANHDPHRYTGPLARQDKAFSMLDPVPAVGATVGGGGNYHEGANVHNEKHTEINVTVPGGSGEGDGARRIAAAIKQRIDEDDHQTAFAAVATGGGH